MPFITPTFEDIRSDILRDIKNLNTDADIGVDSDLYIRASAVASVSTGIYQYQGWIVRQIFPDTADTEFLEWHARTRGLYRKSATTYQRHPDCHRRTRRDGSSRLQCDAR